VLEVGDRRNVAERLEPAQVEPGREVAAGSAQHDDASVGGHAQGVDLFGERAGERGREVVAEGRSVDGQVVRRAVVPGQQLVFDRQLPTGAAMPIT
jgi:hypothetical protein